MCSAHSAREAAAGRTPQRAYAQKAAPSWRRTSERECLGRRLCLPRRLCACGRSSACAAPPSAPQRGCPAAAPPRRSAPHHLRPPLRRPRPGPPLLAYTSRLSPCVMAGTGVGEAKGKADSWAWAGAAAMAGLGGPRPGGGLGCRHDLVCVRLPAKGVRFGSRASLGSRRVWASLHFSRRHCFLLSPPVSTASHVHIL